LKFRDRNGYPCPSNFNPSDFFVQTLAIQPGHEEACRKNVNMLCNNFERGEDGKEIKVCNTHTEINNYTVKSASYNLDLFHNSITRRAPPNQLNYLYL